MNIKRGLLRIWALVAVGCIATPHSSIAADKVPLAPDYKVTRPASTKDDPLCIVTLDGVGLPYVHMSGLTEFALIKIYIESIKAKRCGFLVVLTEELIYRHYYSSKMTRKHFGKMYDKLRKSTEEKFN